MGGGPEPFAPDLAALYLEHREALLRSAKYQLSKFAAVQRAEEAVHDVFAHLMETPPPEPVDNWQHYLGSAVRNRALDIGLEEAGHDRRSEHAIAAYVDEDEFEYFEAELDRGQAANVMNRALAELSDQERWLLLALYRNERKNKDLAEELGVSAGRVSQMHKQALQHFRDAYVALGGRR